MKVLEKIIYCITFGIVFPFAFVWSKLFPHHYCVTIKNLLNRRLTDRARYKNTISMLERKLRNDRI